MRSRVTVETRGEGGESLSGVLSLLGVVDVLAAGGERLLHDEYERCAARVRVYHRSRSSPERARGGRGEPNASPRPRSPSVSPDRRQTRYRITQQAESAYFSSRPPPTPLQLIVRSPSVAPETAAASASAQRHTHTSKKAQEWRRGSGKHKNRRHVKTLLRELVASLPLAEGTSSLTSDSCNAPLVLDVRHVAVQAITTTKPERNSTRNSFRDCGEEWVGGVRALRDSHVRLVLRQLRHIERLNRALDRAANAAAPLLTPHAPSTALSLAK
ncbi:uncharacterized protein LOC128682978 [Plodia interpunctella]|uniref:uncharacterized protein LOC128682978 n=1 Tax=Plodia interpunctella TaxID=58824 RepID=UPI002367E5BD|nr:uncharacterized protein LOC128682978 [Plodia interpunctella]